MDGVVNSSPARTAVGDPARLAAVAATGLIGAAPSPVLDRITALATRLVGCKVALVSLVEQERQCFLSANGPGVPKGVREAPLSFSYCRHVVEAGVPLMVSDAREHPLLRDSPAITQLRAIAYLGVPVRSPDGHVLGTLCAVDDQERPWSGDDLAVMEDLAAAATAEMAARISAQEAAQAAELVHQILDSTLDAFVATDAAGRVAVWNRAAGQLFGWDEPEALGRDLGDLVIAPDNRAAFVEWLGEALRETGAPTGGRRVAFQGVHRGGRRLPVELSLTALRQPGGMAAYLFVRDLTAERRSEMLRRLEYSVAGALTAAQTAEQAAESVVACVGDNLRWPYIEYWHHNADNTGVVRLASWSREPETTAPMQVIDEFGRGHGIVGKAWDSAVEGWITDLPGSGTPRAAAAAESGLRTAVVVPVRDGAEVVGALAAFDRRHTERDPELIAALDTVAAHIGQYMHRRHAEDLELELSRARRELARTVANLSDYVWTARITPAGAVDMVYSSPNTAEICGGPLPDDVDVLTALVSLVHPDDRAALTTFYQEMVSGQPSQVETRFVGVDGQTRWVWTRATPRYEDDVFYLDGASSNVTERHHDHARLRQQAELLDLAPTAVIVRDLDEKITYWNRGAAITYGWSADAALGCRTHRLLDTRFPVRRELAEAALAGTGEWHGELDHLRSDGTRITVLSHQAVQHDEAGNPVAILEVNIDVTARKQAERQRADSEERLRTQFSLATVGQAILALDGALQQVNPALADMLGRPVDELERMTLDDITEPPGRAENHRAAARLFAENRPDARALRMVHADGRIVDAELGMSLLRDADGQPAGFIAVIQDVTARLAAERDRDAAAAALARRNSDLQDTNNQLAAANAFNLDLMGMLSHEIGTPLNSITGYAELLHSDIDSFGPAQRKAVDAITRNARRLEMLRAEILTVCSLDALEMIADPEPVDLRAALADILAGLEIDVPVTCPAGTIVLVHPGHLQQIVTNLCTNADKYAGGVVSITVERRDGTALIAVHDAGPGIPAELRGRLFERYTRAASHAGGHGLGLYIVRSLAEANNGAVGYQPRQPTGSTFTLTLPTTQSSAPGLDPVHPDLASAVARS